ncbi:hypothetical protein BJ546DRAFT_946319 [Cryomyces antarcticus]
MRALCGMQCSTVVTDRQGKTQSVGDATSKPSGSGVAHECKPQGNTVDSIGVRNIRDDGWRCDGIVEIAREAERDYDGARSGTIDSCISYVQMDVCTMPNGDRNTPDLVTHRRLETASYEALEVCKFVNC